MKTQYNILYWSSLVKPEKFERARKGRENLNKNCNGSTQWCVKCCSSFFAILKTMANKTKRITKVWKIIIHLKQSFSNNAESDDTFFSLTRQSHFQDKSYRTKTSETAEDEMTLMLCLLFLSLYIMMMNGWCLWFMFKVKAKILQNVNLFNPLNWRVLS